MKWIAGWIMIFAISWGLGVFICSITAWFKNHKAAKIAAVIFFGLPVVFLLLDIANQERIKYNYEASKDEVKILCAKYGGDKIYKTVDNVEGVFQVVPRMNPITNEATGLSDQYGMIDPYGFAQGDRDDLRSLIGYGIYVGPEEGDAKHYWFVEQQPKPGDLRSNNYRRTYLENNEKFSKGGPLFVTKQKVVTQLLSKYGYIAEDITTKEMRKKWIGAGRIKIIDLQTKEVLAVRTGYYRASGDLLPLKALRWTASGAYHQNRICPTSGDMRRFLHSVLRPPKDLPSLKQLGLIKKD